MRAGKGTVKKRICSWSAGKRKRNKDPFPLFRIITTYYINNEMLMVRASKKPSMWSSSNIQHSRRRPQVREEEKCIFLFCLLSVKKEPLLPTATLYSRSHLPSLKFGLWSSSWMGERRGQNKTTNWTSKEGTAEETTFSKQDEMSHISRWMGGGRPSPS